MRRGLLTVNFNNFLCANSRDSMHAACDRWGIEFCEWNEQTAPRYAVSPACLPAAAFADTPFDEVLILDADTLMSINCPNPFEEFPGPELITVQNGNPERFGDYWAIKNCERYEWNKLASEDDRFAGLPWVDGEYFNSGVVLAKRRHHESMFALALSVVQVDHGLGWNQQTPFNMAARKLGVPVRLVDERWNLIHGLFLGNEWYRQAHIIHFAGETNRERILPTLPWRDNGQ